MLLKIVNENKTFSEFLQFGATNGIQYSFQWMPEHSAYCYAPKTQAECDAIVRANWEYLTCPWRVGPVFDAVVGPLEPAPAGSTPRPAPPVGRIPPYVKPELYAAYPLADLLLLCADSGFTPEGDATLPENVQRQLHRYYEGRAWAAEEMRRLKEENKALEQENAALASGRPAPPPPAKRGPKPKVKAEELQTA